MTTVPAQSPLAQLHEAARRRTVTAMRQAAATAVLVALTYDQVASAADAVETADSAVPPRGRADRARKRAAEERAHAIRAWSRAAALESAGH